MARLSPLILIVDDDPDLRKLVSRTLQIEGLRAVTAADGETALQMMEEEAPSLVLLDVILPGMDGYEVCERLRCLSRVPVIMLTGKSDSQDIVCGLKRGADDYITKPFGMDELLARMNAVLRRSRPVLTAPRRLLRCGDVWIEFPHNRVTVSGKEVILTPTEFSLLRLLAANAGRVVTQQQLIKDVWGPGHAGHTHMLQVTMARLRKKLGDDTADRKYILTHPGIGYLLRRSEDSTTQSRPTPGPQAGRTIPLAR